MNPTPTPDTGHDTHTRAEPDAGNGAPSGAAAARRTLRRAAAAWTVTATAATLWISAHLHANIAAAFARLDVETPLFPSDGQATPAALALTIITVAVLAGRHLLRRAVIYPLLGVTALGGTWATLNHDRLSVGPVPTWLGGTAPTSWATADPYTVLLTIPALLAAGTVITVATTRLLVTARDLRRGTAAGYAIAATALLAAGTWIAGLAGTLNPPTIAWLPPLAATAGWALLIRHTTRPADPARRRTMVVPAAAVAGLLTLAVAATAVIPPLAATRWADRTIHDHAQLVIDDIRDFDGPRLVGADTRLPADMPYVFDGKFVAHLTDTTTTPGPGDPDIDDLGALLYVSRTGKAHDPCQTGSRTTYGNGWVRTLPAPDPATAIAQWEDDWKTEFPARARRHLAAGWTPDPGIRPTQTYAANPDPDARIIEHATTSCSTLADGAAMTSELRTGDPDRCHEVANVDIRIHGTRDRYHVLYRDLGTMPLDPTLDCQAAREAAAQAAADHAADAWDELTELDTDQLDVDAYADYLLKSDTTSGDIPQPGEPITR